MILKFWLVFLLGLWVGTVGTTCRAADDDDGFGWMAALAALTGGTFIALAYRVFA